MRHIDTIKPESIQPNYTDDQRAKVRAFVSSVFALFPAYNDRKEENLQQYCRMYAGDIICFQNDQERLQKLKKLVACQNMNGMVGNYKNAIHALAVACGDMDKLNHDYRTAYPHTQPTGALLAIENQREIDPVKRDQALAEFDTAMKELFSN